MLATRHTQDSWRARLRGCLLAGALGDAVGRPFEGQATVSVQDVRSVLAGAELIWTDDTALLLALAEYLAALEDPAAVDDDALARGLAEAWQAEPDRGYGANPPRVFAAALSGGDWRSVTTSSFGGRGSLGNGGAMRAAPVGALPVPAGQVADLARRTAAVTHAHPDGQDGAALVAVATWACLRTDPERLDPHALLATVAAELTSPTLVAAADAVAATLATEDPRAAARITGTGIAAAEAAPAALSAFLHHPADPAAAVTFAVAMGGDTDTVATMAGCMAGALAGEQALPAAARSRLEQAGRIERAADALAAATWRQP